jgi:hypothetical protein
MIIDDSANRIQASPDKLVKKTKLAAFIAFKQSLKRIKDAIVWQTPLII